MFTYIYIYICINLYILFILYGFIYYSFGVTRRYHFILFIILYHLAVRLAAKGPPVDDSTDDTYSSKVSNATWGPTI